MSELILPKTDIMLSSCKQLGKITQPLKKFGIIGFGYTRVNDNGSMIDMVDRSNAIESSYYTDNSTYEDVAPDACPELLQGEYFLVDCTTSNNPCFQRIHREFGSTHLLAFVKRQPGFFEIFWFNSNTAERFVNLCLNRLTLLESFTTYFKSETLALQRLYLSDPLWRYLDDAAKKRNKAYIEAHRQTPEKLEGESFQAATSGFFYDAVKKRYYIPSKHHLYLTQREMDCLRCCVLGQSGKQTALTLSVTRRTVEAHLDNLKRKLDCNNRIDLVRKAMQLNLVSEDDFIMP